MECRKFKDSIDSYLCGELLVETNLEMLRHAEHCPGCREELTARKQLRGQMQQAAKQIVMSPDAYARLRTRLQAEAAPALAKGSWLVGFKRMWSGRAALAYATVVLCFVFLSWMLTRRQVPQVIAATLSPAVLEQAAQEHELCSHYYATSPEPPGMAAAAVAYDAAYAGLERIAKVRAAGMKLHAAHKCNLVGRNFAHLLFSRDQDLISVLVTERDATAMQGGVVPQDDGLQAGLQQSTNAGCTIHAYQSPRHVVLMVSKLAAEQNKALAESLAASVSEHLRKIK
jgi:anti-sigma factor RsiW